MANPDTTNRSAPQAIESEEAVLGSVLIRPDAYIELAEFLKPADFYSSRNRWIWEAFIRLVEAKASIDIVTVSDDLAEHDQLETVGGSEYLNKLITDVPTAMHAVTYGRVVLRASTARGTLEASRKIAALALQPDLSAEEMVSRAQTITLELAAGIAMDSAATHIGTIGEDYVDDLKERQEHPENFRGVQSGLVDLDALTGGFRAPNLTIIAGRPGAGKTSIMTTAALNATKDHQKQVMIFSLEMAQGQLYERFLSMMTGINVEILNRGATVAEDWPLIQEAKLKLKEYGIYIEDSGMVTPSSIRAKVAKHIMTVGPLDMVIVDYAQLMQGDPGRKWNNRVEEVSHITRNLKLIARQFNVALVAGSQLSRAGDQRQDKRPVLSDLRESGSIEQDSDIVIFSHPSDTENITDLIVAKQRQGATGNATVYFKKQTTSFHNAETRTVILN